MRHAFKRQRRFFKKRPKTAFFEKWRIFGKWPKWPNLREMADLAKFPKKAKNAENGKMPKTLLNLKVFYSLFKLKIKAF
jgi:hypothetical protein